MAENQNQRLRLSIAFAIACISAISVYFTVQRRRQRNKCSSKNLCYLSSEFKPQSIFKRLLADNSYSPFKHFKLPDSTDDWRQRPLVIEMVEYARLDAHYLLYIASCLIKELKAKDKDISYPKDSEFQDVGYHALPEAGRRSNATSLQLFCKESDAFPGESVASSIVSRYLNGQAVGSSKMLGAEFQNNIRKLCAWRDLMARVHDESLRYILSDRAVIALVEKRPKSEKEIYNDLC